MSDDTPGTDVPPAEPPVQNPFVPRYREPWVNPAKRTSAIVLGAVTAVVLLALGFLLGLGLAGGGHRHGFEMRPGMGPGRPGMYGRGYDGRFGPHGPMGRGWAWRHYPPGPYRAPAPTTPPSPSSSHS
jgi:hypothetical protein